MNVNSVPTGILIEENENRFPVLLDGVILSWISSPESSIILLDSFISLSPEIFNAETARSGSILKNSLFSLIRNAENASCACFSISL